MEIWRDSDNKKEALYVCEFGQEQCIPEHAFGPTTRAYILIHFVASGHGTFYSDAGEFKICAGQGFIIFPDQITTYRADFRDPWHYYWIGYSGYDAESITRQIGLSSQNPVVQMPNIDRMRDIIEQMQRDVEQLSTGALAILGGLYQLLALMGQSNQTRRLDAAHEYYTKAMWFMQGHFLLPITITDVANYVGLSRSQLFRVFQEAVGTGPKEQLDRIRLKRAIGLIERSDMQLEQVVTSAGMPSLARLNQLFKAELGMSAGQYRQRHRADG